MRVVPELVFVNCCHLAARNPAQVLVQDATTAAMPDRARFAAGVAEELIKIGVRCVVAAGWAIEDAAASEFAVHLYGALIRGRRFIDAVAEAREAAFAMGGNTWAAYQCYGDPDWRFVRNVRDAQRPVTGRRPKSSRVWPRRRDWSSPSKPWPSEANIRRQRRGTNGSRSFISKRVSGRAGAISGRWRKHLAARGMPPAIGERP